MSRNKRHCLFPKCARTDMENGSELCPGHAVLWARSSHYFSTKPRAEAMAEWFSVIALADAAPVKNGVHKGAYQNGECSKP